MKFEIDVRTVRPNNGGPYGQITNQPNKPETLTVGRAVRPGVLVMHVFAAGDENIVAVRLDEEQRAELIQALLQLEG